MDNSQEMVDLLHQIKNELENINLSLPDLSQIEGLLFQILNELRGR